MSANDYEALQTLPTLKALPSTATIYFKNKKIFNDTVGVTNNLRSLAANIEYFNDILPQNSEKSSGKTDYSLSAETEKESFKLWEEHQK